MTKDHTRKDSVISSFKWKNKNKSIQIATLKLENKELTRQLVLENKASNGLIEQDNDKAETAMTEAHNFMWEDEKEKYVAEVLISAKMERTKQSLKKERVYSARQLEICE